MSVLTDAYSNPTKCCDFLISHLPVTFQVKCYAKSYYVPSFSCSFHRCMSLVISDLSNHDTFHIYINIFLFKNSSVYYSMICDYSSGAWHALL